MSFRAAPERLPTGSASLSELIDALVGAHLLEHDAPFAWPGDVLAASGRLEFHRLHGAAAAEGRPHFAIPAELLAGLVASAAPFAFALIGDGDETAVAVGTTGGEIATNPDGFLRRHAGEGLDPATEREIREALRDRGRDR